MTAKMLLLLAVLAVDLSPCFCQFGEMAGAMGGGMGEMMAGMGAMMGGGIGAMIGGGVGGIGAGIGAMVRQGAMASAVNTINDAVNFIVGPNAKPDQTLLDYGMTQNGPPRTMTQMLPYLPHMQRIARATYGPWLAQMAEKNSAPASSADTTTTNNANKTPTVGKTLTQLEADLDTVIMQRAMQYMDRPQTRQAAADPGAMAAIGAMLPAMIQGIAGAYM